MSHKQEDNGRIGETRTENILLRNFIIHKITPDVDGRDFMAEMFDKTSSVLAIIQSKYFENNNEVKIRKEYIWDEDGIKTEFFASLHTDDKTNKEIQYFFSAQEIKDNWSLTNRKQGKKQIDYYVFQLNKNHSRKFDPFRNISKSEITTRIQDGIKQTEEFRNEKNIRLIKGISAGNYI
ncbi:MAG: hypothetical protein HRT71_12380 [Flavobacteriales bacterium]|nr:hypothetical protein [Flavobacteriales bacterium]